MAVDQNIREKLFQVIDSNFSISRGSPMPLGPTLQRHGINFAVFSKHATGVTLVLFVPGEMEPIAEFPLDPHYNRTGQVWHAFVSGVDVGIQYGYRMQGPHDHIHKFDYDQVLLDPYARSVSGSSRWGSRHDIDHHHDPLAEGGEVHGQHSVVVDGEFDWEFDQPLNRPLWETIIYEMHVRGMTANKNSGVKHPGTFKGLIDKIPYLKELGITAIELLPINEFDESGNWRRNPLTGERLFDYWGYNSIAFFAAKAAYASDNGVGAEVNEFKTMVKAMHDSGIEVILDIVFNHTSEGDERGRTLSFRGIDNSVYYMIDPKTGRHYNYSGCGNTMNCNHPVVRDMILDSLRYWVTEMHVDGFRFDLASILGRGQDGSVLPNPPLLERIAADPVLANTKIIAEAWDAGGLYQVGTFPAWGRWAEWNGKFRDDIRSFVKSDAGAVASLATRLSGSADLYQGSGRAPYHSINFVTSHDGFTMSDLVSYNSKHNESNGERGADGDNDNHSWNCGAEGPTKSAEINKLRRQQVKNMATLLMLSHGVPMLLAGDEFGRTQNGNNNAYCQDNTTSWVDWSLAEKNKELLEFFQRLIQFRRRNAIFQRRTFGDDGITIAWHGMHLNQPDWSWESRSLAMRMFENQGTEDSTDIYLIAHAHWEPAAFELPALPSGRKWYRFIDTACGKDAITEADCELPLPDQCNYSVFPRSTVLLIAKDIETQPLPSSN
ncbi:Glycogen debranching enzyme [Symmachiella macrocystis]|uniref:Glycogen debranching enzyme n=1 Tax=Symmachiella macrocystis TaxID=2527985 RepID=A0A5C6BBS6_9PLAN|nr:glycogen debranching protein GlgX [Symmachiella macrocystis]TWU08719.1 Glycogen debranching enzyme [Symmachiella macrocystis]